MSGERDALVGCKRVVVKIGSRLLAESPAGRPAAIADQIAELRRRDVEVIVVSSGAIALGVRALGLAARPHELPQLQAAAAVGQNRLMQQWQHAFDTVFRDHPAEEADPRYSLHRPRDTEQGAPRRQIPANAAIQSRESNPFMISSRSNPATGEPSGLSTAISRRG